MVHTVHLTEIIFGLTDLATFARQGDCFNEATYLKTIMANSKANFQHLNCYHFLAQLIYRNFR